MPTTGNSDRRLVLATGLWCRIIIIMWKTGLPHLIEIVGILHHPGTPLATPGTYSTTPGIKEQTSWPTKDIEPPGTKPNTANEHLSHLPLTYLYLYPSNCFI